MNQRRGNDVDTVRLPPSEVPEHRTENPNWWTDRWNVFLLLFLYILQGIPMGLTASIPMILQSRHVSYKEQAVFSFVYWPFSIKLLWAPIVDSLFIPRMGRRKTWLVPMQYLIGLFMLFLSYSVSTLLGDHGEPPNVTILTLLFFLMYIFSATQDIAVDGWALTMLSRCNIGYASTCNTVGQTTGYFLGYTIFLALESKDFCNNYLRSTPLDRGIFQLEDFLYFWGLVFLVTTTMVWFFKREVESHEEKGISVISTYKQLLSVLQLKPVLQYALAHFTARVSALIVYIVEYIYAVVYNSVEY